MQTVFGSTKSSVLAAGGTQNLFFGGVSSAIFMVWNGGAVRSLVTSRRY